MINYKQTEEELRIERKKFNMINNNKTMTIYNLTKDTPNYDVLELIGKCVGAFRSSEGTIKDGYSVMLTDDTTIEVSDY